MPDYETVRVEGEKFGILNITPEEFERNKNFTSLVTILTRIKNERGDTAKRVRKAAQVQREIKAQPEPEILSMPRRAGPEKCSLFAKVKRYCDKEGFSCDSNCWARITGAVFCVEGLTVGVGVTPTTSPKRPEGGLFGW